MKTRNSHGLLQLHLGREALSYCQCLYRENKALFMSVDLIGEKNQVILEFPISYSSTPSSIYIIIKFIGIFQFVRCFIPKRFYLKKGLICPNYTLFTLRKLRLQTRFLNMFPTFLRSRCNNSCHDFGWNRWLRRDRRTTVDNP